VRKPEDEDYTLAGIGVKRHDVPMPRHVTS
jgi:hypothetical protein